MLALLTVSQKKLGLSDGPKLVGSQLSEYQDFCMLQNSKTSNPVVHGRIQYKIPHFHLKIYWSPLGMIKGFPDVKKKQHHSHTHSNE